MNRTLFILTGFTAVGKTRLSLNWAKKNRAEIVSCDSLLFYRHMNIGTAKPTIEEMSEVPHHMIDIQNPSEQYSINEYVKKASKVVKEIHSRDNRVLVVGGSGFYLKSFFSSVVDNLKLDPEIKNELEAKFESQSLMDSVAELERLNPYGLGNLDTENPRRVLKAWMRCVASGKTLLELKDRFDSQPGEFDSYNTELLVLERPREELEERVRIRVDGLLADGLVEEVRELLRLGIEKNPSAATAIGYRETIEFIKGRLNESELASSIAQNTRKLLKKQRTWFKKFLPAKAVCDVSSLNELPEQWHSTRGSARPR